jgi:hypothetical protein
VAAAASPLLFAQPENIPTFGTTVVVPGGLVGVIYNIPRWSKSVPFLPTLRPVGMIYASSLNIPPRDFKEGFPGVTDRFEWFAIDYTGRFWIEKPGWYRFALTSDDGSLLYIDDQLAIDNDGVHPPETKTTSVKLAGGIHRIQVSYFQGPRFQVALILEIAGPGEELRVFSTEEFKPPPNPDTWAYADSSGQPSSARLDLETAPEIASPGDDVKLHISLRAPSGNEPIALSWNLVVPAEIVEIRGSPRSAGSASGKSLRCSRQKSYLYFCTLSGDLDPIAAGVFATINFKVRRDAQAGPAHFRIEDAEATAANGRRHAVTGAEAALTIR